jgi:hypothetical protein
MICDLNGKDAKTNVGVIIETKSPVNKTEMITVANLNAWQAFVLCQEHHP